jgi:hypothetical protein
MNNTYVSNPDPAISSALNRRTFLIGIGSVAMLLTACGSKLSPEVDRTASEIQEIISAKEVLISDATNLMKTDATLTAPLQVVIDQSRLHIEALSQYSTIRSSPSVAEPREVNLPALASRCAVFSTNNVGLACTLTDSELSRTIALIAASEMQHHALLSGYIE